jgi:hypothetical protein
MEGKTIVFDNPDADKYSSVFATRGTVTVSPTELYDKLDVPEEMRATFTVKPFNPIAFEEMRRVNSEAYSYAKKYIESAGHEYVPFVTTLDSLNIAIDEFIDPTPDDKIEEYATAINLKNELMEIWVAANCERDKHRDWNKVFTIIEQHVETVTNLITVNEDGEYESYTGGVNMGTLFLLPPAIAYWLDREVQKVSKLTDAEITSL